MIKRGILFCLFAASAVSASVFLPYNGKATSKTYGDPSFSTKTQQGGVDLALLRAEATRLRRTTNSAGPAMAIPGYGLTEQIFVGGFMNFLSIYNIVITARILLSCES